MTVLYESGLAYETDYTYWGAGSGEMPVVKVEMDLSSTFPTEVLDIDYGGVLAYSTSSEYNPEDRYDGFVIFDDITSSVRSIDIVRGKSSMTYEHFDASTCSLEIADFNSTFLPDEPNSPYYPNVKPLRQVRISATWSGDTFVVYRGFVDKWDILWRPKLEYSEVRVETTDAIKLLANFDTEFNGADYDPVWERVSDMLVDKNWPADFTDVDNTGYFAQLVEDTTDRRELLPNLQEYEFTEQGALFVSKEGRITWKNIVKANPLLTDSPEWVFSDAGTPGTIPVTQVDYAVSDETVYNLISITPTLGTEQIQSNNDSIDTYRERALTRTDVPLTTDPAANSLASFILAKQGFPLSRIRSVSTDPRLSTTAAGAILRSDLMTKVNIIRTPPSGTTSTYKMFLIGLRHTITPESWTTDFITDYRRETFSVSAPGTIVIP